MYFELSNFITWRLELKLVIKSLLLIDLITRLSSKRRVIKLLNSNYNYFTLFVYIYRRDCIARNHKNCSWIIYCTRQNIFNIQHNIYILYFVSTVDSVFEHLIWSKLSRANSRLLIRKLKNRKWSLPLLTSIVLLSSSSFSIFPAILD